ncbi:MAG: deoxyribodipyrimidine photolyase [Fimbriiglobus sp.]|jgi:deoxyribodipyrimidine photo-lyase|nr:deoxyribodipyrimidine photolyase [Fimbriiglobus sp.]
MNTINTARVRNANDRPVNPAGKYVLYWVQMFRRLSHNHALDHALAAARQLNKPLVIYEGLKLNYPWASARFHQFILEGMRNSHSVAKVVGATYWPFVEVPGNTGRGLVRKLCDDASLLVTDDFPQFIVPAQIRAVADSVNVAMQAIDSNSVVPLALLGPPTAAAAHLRPKLHKLFAEAWKYRANPSPDFDGLQGKGIAAPFELWTPPKDLAAFVRSLPIDQSVPPVPGEVGGQAEGKRLVASFVSDKLGRYADHRSQPNDPESVSASRLSYHLHYGHLSMDEVAEAVLGEGWNPNLLNPKTRNKDDFFCRDPNINSYLDEAITWRSVGYQWHFARRPAAVGRKSWQDLGERPSFNFDTFDYSPQSERGTLAGVLPEWALATLSKHSSDPRSHLYTLEQFDAAETHDDLWNAAQQELRASGRIHNYLRMLWGKKVLEWSPSPEAAYRVLEHLNNKYALDGRDPNSYSGILWCFGLFDRPWPPEREVFGNIRYMSSQNTAKKFKLDGYFRYVRRLGSMPSQG